jgi:hypothetical protein
MKCPYCVQDAKLVTGEEIYPKRPDLHKKKYWLCSACGAYVGCHGDTDKPLGRLADAQLRALKIKAHIALDRLWKNGHMSRTYAYLWLAEQLGIAECECHIGMFSTQRCKDVITLCNEKYQDLKESIYCHKGRAHIWDE